MTLPQFIGLMAVWFLLCDLGFWMQRLNAPQAQRTKHLRGPLVVGLVFAPVFGGVWALLTFFPGGRSAGPPAPWWGTAFMALLLLLALALVLKELRQTLPRRHNGAAREE